ERYGHQIEDGAVAVLACDQRFALPAAFDRHTDEAFDPVDEREVAGLRDAGRPIVEREGAQQAAVGARNRGRPTGPKAETLGDVTISRPERVGANVGNDHLAAPKGGGAA